jgi:hypothetical protein
MVDGEHTAGKAERQIVVEPGFERHSTRGIGQGSDAFANLA